MIRTVLERISIIHYEIEAAAFPNATTLSRVLEVSTKSIQRDLEFMRDRLCLPIEYDVHRWGYYYSTPIKGCCFCRQVKPSLLTEDRRRVGVEPATAALPFQPHRRKLLLSGIRWD
jgi:hypothetical protein